MTDVQRADRVAGIAAILAGGSWMSWAVLNTLSHGGFEHGVTGSRAVRAAALLTAGWNLLLVPALLRIHARVVQESPARAPIWSTAGLLSLSFWAFGGLTAITGPLETVYLALSATWLLGVGGLLRGRHSAFAAFTTIVGGFTVLDAAFTFFEPMPFVLYALAAPKLPLAAAWSIVTGSMLLSGRMHAGATALEVNRSAASDLPH